MKWEDLKQFAQTHGMTHAILLAHDGHRDHVVTWGNTVVDAQRTANFGNALKKQLGWPESLMAQPDRVTDLITACRAAYITLIGDEYFHDNQKLVATLKAALDAASPQ